MAVFRAPDRPAPGGRAPEGPGPAGAQRKKGLDFQGRQRVQAPHRRRPGQLHAGAADRRQVRPCLCVAWASTQSQAQPVPGSVAVVRQLDVKRHRLSRMHRSGCQQVQGDPAQVGVALDQADPCAAGQQEGEQVTEVELVIDAGQQQHQQGQRQHPAGSRGQDVHVAVGQAECVCARQAVVKPLPQAMVGPQSPMCRAGRRRLHVRGGVWRPAGRAPVPRHPDRPG